MKKFAVFDIDGTLYRWQLYHDLVQTLARAEYFSNNIPRELDEKWNDWRGRAISFDEYENFVVQTMVKNLPLIPIPAFEAACDKVVAESGHKTHYYPRELLKKLKGEGYEILAITGSQNELVERFGVRYGFDCVVGASYERSGDHFTGKIAASTVGRKPEVLRDLVDTRQLTWSGSVAIGDSVGDANILELVEKPIAFNPDAGLFDRAKKEGWPVVIERKNIAYSLEKKDNALVLARTIIY